MTSGTFEELWEKLESSKKAYKVLLERSERGESPITSESDRLTVLKNNLDDILLKAEEELFDQWEYDEIISGTVILLNAVNSALCSAEAMSSSD